MSSPSCISRFRRAFASRCIGLALYSPIGAAEAWKLPPLDGELAGEFSVPLLDPAPRLKWTLTLRTGKPRERTVGFLIEGAGMRVRGEALLDPAGEGTWRIFEAEVDLAEWFRVTPLFVPGTAGITTGGNLTFTGSGTWRDGAIGGTGTVSLREGRIDDPTHKILLEGISVDVEFADIATLRTAPAQVFTWRSGRYDVVPLGVGRIEFDMDADEVRVTSSLIDVFGGELQIGSLVMSMQRPEFTVDAKMVGVDVGQVLFLLPPVLTDARGRLDGHVALKRDASGLQLGAGNLSLRPGETAQLRLAPTPGLLSSSLPPMVLQHYPGLKKIEMGEAPLRAEELEVTFTPEGDAEGRTARVHVVGGPVDPNLRAPINLNVNVRGPLQSLIRFGTNSRLRFGAGR
ncbi:MAG: intermembrane phospholipid transport protein YdbH family protein [Opitutaceae bacterium]